jgi:hypothetical protein
MKLPRFRRKPDLQAIALAAAAILATVVACSMIYIDFRTLIG